MNSTQRAAPLLLVLMAFAAVYLIWGSTYLAIRFGVESMPPFLMAGARFIVAGGVLYTVCRLRGVPRPTTAQWRTTAVIGSLLLLGGNGLVTWAEQWVPSGLAALLVAAVPLWMALLSWVLEPANRMGRRGIAGIVLGFVGVGLLVKPGGDLSGDPRVVAGAVALVIASLMWATGSLYSRRVKLPSQPFLSTAMQMLTGGVALGIVGTVGGEWSRVDLAAVTSKSWWAFAYLTTFGSIVAFSAYVWLLRVSTASRVSTYAYVNPVVAVFLGWSLGGETVSASTVIAAAVIVSAVAMITTEKKGSERRKVTPSGAAESDPPASETAIRPPLERAESR